ncbi:MAG: hydrogenase expression/formation protein HypE [Porphyromonadaceae bacterium]|nr:MAG: hydrogenase expression/formation protein HypE [Porphyromonadaceae bacterium]
MKDKILLAHGSGGRMTRELIRELFQPYLHNQYLDKESDAAILKQLSGKIAVSTDAFVVNPVIFPGGDIGKLAICGTINDLAVSGAKPHSITASFILEEGLRKTELEQIVASMSSEIKNLDIALIAADTKVVPSGLCDKIYITTTGIGTVIPGLEQVSTGKGIQAGDRIILSGTIGDHGAAIFCARYPEDILTTIVSDCACLYPLIEKISSFGTGIRFMRDPTRGGLATVLCEVAENQDWGLTIKENLIPVRNEVAGLCDLVGLDPLYLANEGKFIMVAAESISNEVLTALRSHPLGKNACEIGVVTRENPGRVILETPIGGTRLLTMLSGDPLPRIC